MRLDQLTTQWAERCPHHLAVDGDDPLTYGDLDQLANRFARWFVGVGVRPGDRVGVHVPRSGRAVAAMMGALRAGATYVPLDPGSPPPRIQLIARDCDLRHVVITPKLLGHCLSAGMSEPIEHFLLSGDAVPPASNLPRLVHPWSELERLSSAPLESVGENPDDLAYLLYTSGSTGIPKGVMLSHRNALAFADWAADAICLSEADRVASVAPFHFDLSVFDLWASLSRGATVVIVDEATVLSGRRMLDRIAEKEITVWYSVPSALVLMMENGLAERMPNSLRVVFFAGEVFPMKHLRRVMTALPRTRFYNLFGPTETNVCLAHELTSVPPEGAAAIPIGIPSCGDVVSIRGPDGSEVQDGEVGELFVDGPTVMLGYWDGGRCTPAPRPYPTGDLVSRSPGGVIMFHGRRDHLVKIHGHRVELGEVEAALLSHPGVDDAIALALDQVLVVVVVPSDRSVSVLDLKRHCAARLPRYMVPGEVRLVEQLPRTSSGKVDRVRTKAALVAGDSSVLRVARRPGTTRNMSWKRV